NFIDKQNVTRLQVGHKRSEITRFFQHRTRGGFQIRVHFRGNAIAESGFATTGRTEYQRMVEWLTALPCRANKNFHLFAHDWLADVIAQGLWAYGAVLYILAGLGHAIDKTPPAEFIRFDHWTALAELLRHHAAQCKANQILATLYCLLCHNGIQSFGGLHRFIAQRNQGAFSIRKYLVAG